MSASPNKFRFLVDENVRVEVFEFLKERGFDAKLVSKGMKNGEVFGLARLEERTLLTCDTDFANAFLYPPKELPGLVIFRIHPPAAEKFILSLTKLLEKVSPQDLTGKLIFLEENRFEIIE